MSNDSASYTFMKYRDAMNKFDQEFYESHKLMMAELDKVNDDNVDATEETGVDEWSSYGVSLVPKDSNL